MKKKFLSLFVLAVMTKMADAAVVTLRDNTQLEGTIVSATARDIQIHTSKGLLTLGTERILRIDYNAGEAPASSPSFSKSDPITAPETRVSYETYPPKPTTQSFSLGLGMVVPLSRVDFASTGGGTGDNGDSGVLIGGRYLFDVNSRLSLGPDLQFSHRSRTASQSLLPASNTDVFGNSLLILATAKWTLVKEGVARPYLLAGVGTNRTSTIIESTPNPGYGWSDTNTDETRTLVDDARWGLATQLGFGLDFPVAEPLAFGLEFGWIHVANPSNSATTAGNDVGLTSITGVQNTMAVTARWSWRF